MAFDPASMRAYGFGINEPQDERRLNWQQCLYAPHSGDCLIQLVEDGPWYYATGEAMEQHAFGADEPPIDPYNFEGPFVFASSEEAVATYVLCGGELPRSPRE